ncbi:hypothetical protein PY650_22025 [Rhizobium calliandrae]|uniref:Uncharacterized protein n=1 Tax=Rhizobium calliandrae TaxID=1312182 RepID=A0ABT7KLZ8_9HYPH|nr:hypothetical protein [Rhizobium calliandrae]MDL2408274.1 hypothetical protein [Rhizobium calliandrae]
MSFAVQLTTGAAAGPERPARFLAGQWRHRLLRLAVPIAGKEQNRRSASPPAASEKVSMLASSTTGDRAHAFGTESDGTALSPPDIGMQTLFKFLFASGVPFAEKFDRIDLKGKFSSR